MLDPKGILSNHIIDALFGQTAPSAAPSAAQQDAQPTLTPTPTSE